MLGTGTVAVTRVAGLMDVGKMTNCIMTVSSVVDQYPGLSDPLSLDLYDWNDRLKGTFELSDVDALVTQLREQIFVDSTGGFLTSPVISERLLFKKDRKDSSGEEIIASLVWNERELVRFERLSGQSIESRVHELAYAILQLPEFIKEREGEFEPIIEDFTSETEKDVLRNRKELLNMNKVIKKAIETEAQKAETRQFLKGSEEDEKTSELKRLEDTRKIAEKKAFYEAKTEETKGRFSAVCSDFAKQAEACDQALIQERANTNAIREAVQEAWSANYKVSFDIENKERKLSQLQQEIANIH